MTDLKRTFFLEQLIDPVSKKSLVSIEEELLFFSEDLTHPIHRGIPIVIDANESIFSIEDIVKEVPTAQDASYRKKSLKTLVRQKVLPSLSQDFTLVERYQKLATIYATSRILVIGAGAKVTWYKDLFPNALVITSDIHTQFKADIVIDAHQIPFKDHTFDLIIAGQVLEHCFKPWVVAQEIERVCKKGGNMLIEVPFNFPYHSPPYDFFRFTFTGLRSLFPKSRLEQCEIGEGNASTVAIYNSQWMVDLFSNRYMRSAMLFISRLLFGWMKYVDKLFKKVNLRTVSIPKGFSMLFEKDDVLRSNTDLLKEYYGLKK